jgi:putative nucleotidyltransferase with HDIG domain
MFKILFDAFEKEGKKIYHVGGSVRDTLLGKSPKDYDFTTDALPDVTQKILDNAGLKSWPLGEKFGTHAAIIGDNQIEITTHRLDLTPGRHPDVMFTTDIKEDLARRDLTINSMAMDFDGNLIDPFGGAEDLSKKTIRTTGSPYERFGEDPLRMLRAIRFISQLGFNLDVFSFKAIRGYAQSIMSVSRERWLAEMNKLLSGPYASEAVDYLKGSGLLWYIIPELYPVITPPVGRIKSKDLWHHIITVLGKSPCNADIRWAALLHDIAKPQTRTEKHKKVHFFEHAALGTEIVEGIARRLKMGNRQRRNVKGLIYLHHRVGDVVSRKHDPPVSKSALRRVIRSCEDYGCDINDLIDLFEADSSSRKPDVLERQHAHAILLKKGVEELKKEADRPQLPTGIGNEIMSRFNLKPSPEVGKIKKILDEMLLDGIINGDMSFDEIFLKMRELED